MSKHIIRCRQLTCAVHPKKYYDVEGQKFITDKMRTIGSHSFDEIIDDEWHNYSFRYSKIKNDEGGTSTLWSFPKFVPKDDD